MELVQLNKDNQQKNQNLENGKKTLLLKLKMMENNNKNKKIKISKEKKKNIFSRKK